MRGRESTRHLHGDLDGTARREGALLQQVPQRLARQQLHDDEQAALLHAGIEDADDIRVLERRHGLRFTLESRSPIVW